MIFVLCTPPFDLFKDGYGTKRSIKKGHMPPLGIGYIASAALKAGIDTYIVDPSVLNLDFEETVDLIARYKPDAIGISTMTANESHAVKLADMLKERLNLPIVIGGPHATCYPEEIVRSNRSIDYVVSGEGEVPIAPLLKNIRNGTRPYNLKGVTFRDGGSLINNGKAEIEYRLDNIDPPARYLYRNDLYAPLPYSYRRLPATSMITSRGCHYSKCTFCFSAGKMKERYRRHSTLRVVDEIKHIVKEYNIKEIMFCDDNFLVNKKWVMEFCDLLDKNMLDISWSCAGRADTVDLEMLKRVKSVGCWTVFYGFESGIQHLLDMIKKGITIEGIRKSVEWTHKAGLETRGSFMLALPGETPREGLATIDFAISLNLDYAQFTATFPDPGTGLFDIAKAHGRITKYRGMNKATFIPEAYKDEEEVEKIVKTAYRKFYFRPRYVLKRIMSIRNISDFLRYIEGFLFLKGLQ